MSPAVSREEQVSMIRNAVDAAATRVRPRLRSALQQRVPEGLRDRLMAGRDRLQAGRERLWGAAAPGGITSRTASRGAPGAEHGGRRGPQRGAQHFADFFANLAVDGEIERPAVVMTRRMIAADLTTAARGIAQVLQRYPDLRPVGDVCAALCAFVAPMDDIAWALFTRNDRALVVSLAGREFLVLGFRLDPPVAAEVLGHVLDSTLAFEPSPDGWLDVADAALAAGYPQLCTGTLERAEQSLVQAPPDRLDRLRARIATMRDFARRPTGADAAPAPGAGGAAFALLDYRHPDWRRASTSLSDAAETLVVLAHLARHDSVRFEGPPELVAAAERVRDQLDPSDQLTADPSDDHAAVDGSGVAPATVRLHTLDRDASRYAAVPDGTWTVLSDWFAQPREDLRFDLPLDPRLRPIFISFYIDVPALSAPGAIDYLSRYAPIGCLDWDTVFLLQAAGVPAFFSGALASTVDLALGKDSGSDPAGPGSSEPDAAGDQASLRRPEMRERALAENLADAQHVLAGFRDGGRVITSDLRGYLAARALGCPAEFRRPAAGPAMGGLSHLKGIADLGSIEPDEFAAMRRGITAKLAAVLGAIVAGRGEDEVYAAWREACAADVAHARELLGSVEGFPTLSFDVHQACATIRDAAVTVERSRPGPDGAEINIEFSVDGNYKHQLDIVLDSVVAHASRPVRAFVLCRDHGPADFERMARLFPTVSFVWLQTDHVEYGPIPAKIKWATIATMDRTMLPELLHDIDRIIHLDLDALCVADMAELFDVDMAGNAIAAANEPQQKYGSGFDAIRRTAVRLRGEGKPDLAREFIIRTHAQHRFDFRIFNAGLMVLDLARMRADQFCAHYLPYVQKYGVNGQGVLNFYVGNRYTRLDGTWNRLVRLEIPEPVKIAHWAGPIKPWRGHKYVTGRELWDEQEERFAERTSGLV